MIRIFPVRTIDYLGALQKFHVVLLFDMLQLQIVSLIDGTIECERILLQAMHALNLALLFLKSH